MPRRKKVHFDDGLIGDGFDVFQPRDDYNNKSKKTIQDFGAWTVRRLVLSRSPIRSILRKGVNLLTFGTFETLLQKYGFDKLYHLSAIADVEESGVSKRIVMEKIHVVNISTSYKQEAETDLYNIPITKQITLKEMLDNTQKLMGSKYFLYDAFSNNCQSWVDSLLTANGLNTPQAHAWLFQSMEQIKNQVPEISKKAINAITDTGAVVDRLVGNGEFDLDTVILTIAKGKK